MRFTSTQRWRGPGVGAGRIAILVVVVRVAVFLSRALEGKETAHRVQEEVLSAWLSYR